MKYSNRIAIYIDPPSHHFLNDRLFDANSSPYLGDQLMAPYSYLHKFFTAKGIQVRTADFLRPEKKDGLNIYISMGRLQDYQRVARREDTILSAFFAMECPINDPIMYRSLKNIQHFFRRVFSWADSISLERFTGVPLHLESFKWPQSYNQVHDKLWRNTNRKFLVMVNSNKLPRLKWQELQTERLRAIAYFSKTGEIDLYGREWDKPPSRVGFHHIPYTLRRLHRMAIEYWHRLRPDPLLEAARRVYRGPAESKSRVLSQYNFCICFENMIMKGWITEKIFDCFYSGTIPIYWGAPDIADHIPPDCFIDMRNFTTYDELALYLHSLSEQDIRHYKQRAKKFIESPQFYPFSKEAFTKIFCRIVEEDTGLELRDEV